MVLTYPGSSRKILSVASRAASVSLHTRRALASGCFLMIETRSLLPAIIPAWGPPMSLSPELVTSAAPALMLMGMVGSGGSPNRDRSTREPAPRSSMTGMPVSAPRATRSSSGTSDEKPLMR